MTEYKTVVIPSGIPELERFDAGVHRAADILLLMKAIIAEQGTDALIEFDAGYNNISLDVVRRVPKKKEVPRDEQDAADLLRERGYQVLKQKSKGKGKE